MSRHFFALFSRMKHLDRWALMRNTRPEPLSDHALEVAAIAHCLAEIGNRRLGRRYDPGRAALLGMYHDMPEILTGDLPTPVKYMNPEIRSAYASIEQTAKRALLDTLPGDLVPAFRPLLDPAPETPEAPLVKAADKISALIKCVEERNAGNREFSAAESATRAALEALACPEAEIFLSEFMESYSLVLDSVLTDEAE